MSDVRPYLWLIPALPLAAAVIIGFFGPRLCAATAIGRASSPAPAPASSPSDRHSSTVRATHRTTRRARMRSRPIEQINDYYDGSRSAMPRLAEASTSASAARRRAGGHDARDGHVHRHAHRHLFRRLHARRPGLSALLRRGVAVRLLDDHAGAGGQLHSALSPAGKASACAAIC